MQLRYLEFYAGIGGWSMALQEALPTVFSVDVRLQCCAALDHSDLCMEVYQHNHQQHALESFNQKNGTKKTKLASNKAVCIEKLTVQQLTDWKADLWMMSPPCQPHTRQHSNQESDLDDARSNSFLHICELLVKLPPESKPAIILLENVIGFESSNSCRTWMHAVGSSNYVAAHFHLQPTQAGLPNDRPRYYCVAVQRDKLVADQGWLEHYFQASVQSETSDSKWQPRVHTSLRELDLVPEDTMNQDKLPALGSFLDKNVDGASLLRVPLSVLQRPAAWCLDIVAPDSTRTSCFTSSYGKYIKGTGSVLLQPGKELSSTDSNRDKNLLSKFAMVPPEERQYDPDWSAALTNSGYYLRYFSGSELARLFGFHGSFQFPANVTVKQQWKLIGNSLNVSVASKMVQLGLRSVYGTSGSKR
jgi:tRNA (cytosine38-C5)-methyltransferase